MDITDRKIAEIIQKDGRTSSAEMANAVGVSVSTANERVRRLSASGIIKEWRGVLDPIKVGAKLCALILVDMSYDGEDDAVRKLSTFPEIQEIHHISGAHSYMVKVRVADTSALQRFLHDRVKKLPAVTSTESMIVLETMKETTEVLIERSEE